MTIRWASPIRQAYQQRSSQSIDYSGADPKLVNIVHKLARAAMVTGGIIGGIIRTPIALALGNPALIGVTIGAVFGLAGAALKDIGKRIVNKIHAKLSGTSDTDANIVPIDKKQSNIRGSRNKLYRKFREADEACQVRNTQENSNLTKVPEKFIEIMIFAMTRP